MPLKLRVISDQYKELGKSSSQLFGVTGGRIGRAPDNDWVLPDPDRYVSSHHAAISFRSGSWILEDTSTNGIYVNDSDSPLSVTGPRKLKDGDRLRFGDYDILVSIDERNDFSADASGQMPQPSVLQERRGKPGGAPEQADYLRNGTFRNHSRSQTREHMGEDLGEDLDITGLLVSGSRDNQNDLDAVAEFDRGIQEQTNAPRTTVKSVVGRSPTATTNAAASVTAPKSLLDDFLEQDLPRPAAPSETGDDWHMSTRRLQQRRPAATPLLQVVASPAPQPTPQPVVREAPVPVKRLEPVARAEPIKREPPPRVEPIRAEPARNEPVREPERARRTNDAAGDMQTGIDALCRGAGIDPTALPADAYATLLTLAGQMLREVVLDLMEALRSRGDQKSRMQLSQTTIQPSQNNPLKFSASVEEALRKLLDAHSSRYLGAVDSLREAFTDLKNHQLATDAGMHAALNDVLGRVDPTELQERFDRGLKRNPLLGAVNKSKYWDLYSEFYPLLNQRDARGWPAVFTEEFTRAYAAKVDELENSRRK